MAFSSMNRLISTLSSCRPWPPGALTPGASGRPSSQQATTASPIRRRRACAGVSAAWATIVVPPNPAALPMPVAAAVAPARRRPGELTVAVPSGRGWATVRVPSVGWPPIPARSRAVAPAVVVAGRGRAADDDRAEQVLERVAAAAGRQRARCRDVHAVLTGHAIRVAERVALAGRQADERVLGAVAPPQLHVEPRERGARGHGVLDRLADACAGPRRQGREAVAWVRWRLAAYRRGREQQAREQQPGRDRSHRAHSGGTPTRPRPLTHVRYVRVPRIVRSEVVIAVIWTRNVPFGSPRRSTCAVSRRSFRTLPRIVR